MEMIAIGTMETKTSVVHMMILISTRMKCAVLATVELTEVALTQATERQTKEATVARGTSITNQVVETMIAISSIQT